MTPDLAKGLLAGWGRTGKTSRRSGKTPSSFRRLKVLVPALFLFASLTSVADAEAKVSLVFGVYTSDKPSAMVAQLRPCLDLVEEYAGDILGEPVEVQLQVVKGYVAGAELILSGKADFMRLGPASYVKVKTKDPAIELLVMENNNGVNRFNGIIAVHTDSDFTDIRQLRGHTFAFGSKRSTLGRYFAQLELARAGVFADDLKRYEYLGRHDKVGAAVGAGLFDAGALEETMFRKLQSEGVPIRAIYTFRNATKAWAARSGLDPKVKDALRRALLKIEDPVALAALRFDGFLPGTDADYDPTREAMQMNDRFFKKSSDAGDKKVTGALSR